MSHVMLSSMNFHFLIHPIPLPHLLLHHHHYLYLLLLAPDLLHLYHLPPIHLLPQNCLLYLFLLRPLLLPHLLLPHHLLPLLLPLLMLNHVIYLVSLLLLYHYRLFIVLQILPILILWLQGQKLVFINPRCFKHLLMMMI